MSRDDLWRRLDLAHAMAVDTRARADQAVKDRGALIEALVQDGASYREIAAHLPGEDGQPISKQRVGAILAAYREAVDR